MVEMLTNDLGSVTVDGEDEDDGMLVTVDGEDEDDGMHDSGDDDDDGDNVEWRG